MNTQKDYGSQKHGNSAVPPAEAPNAAQDSKNFMNLITSIRKRLDHIPSKYKQNPETFNSLEQVINIMKSENFEQLKNELEYNLHISDKSAKSIVKAQYHGFNKSIKNYTLASNAINETIDAAVKLHADVEKCAGLFTSRSHSINTIYLQLIEHVYAIEILDNVTSINNVPERFEKAFNSKEYVKAASILVDAVDKLYQEDLLKIGALADLQTEIVEKKGAFYRTLIKMLNDLIYLNSIDEFPDMVEQKDVESSLALDFSYAGTMSSAYSKSRKSDQDDIHSKLNEIISAIFVLKKEKQSITRILERSKVELHNAVRKAIIWIKKKHEASTDYSPQGTTDSTRSKGFSKANLESGSLCREVIKGVLELFLKILKNHKMVAEIFKNKLQNSDEDELVRLSGEFQMNGERPGTSTSAQADQKFFSYQLEHVWNLFQMELQCLVGYYVPGLKNAWNADENEIVYKSQSENQRLFSFSNSVAFSFFGIRDPQIFHYDQMDIGEPSIYNILPMYPLLVSFIESVQLVVGIKASEYLRSWLDNCITTVLTENIHNDYKKRAEMTCNEPDSFKLKYRSLMLSYSSDELKRPLLSVVVEMFRCISELYDGLFYMFQYASHFQSIIQTCLQTLKEASKNKIKSIIHGTEVERALESKELQAVLENDLSWKMTSCQEKSASTPPGFQVQQDSYARKMEKSDSRLGLEDGLDQLSVAEQGAKYEEALICLEYAWYDGVTKTGTPLRKEHIITDHASLAMLAAMSDSLSWISAKVHNLNSEVYLSIRERSLSTIEEKGVKMEDFEKSHLSSTTDDAASVTDSLGSNDWKPIRGVDDDCVLTDTVIQRTSGVNSSLIRVSEQCLQAIYLNLRIQTCYFLYSMSSNYVLPYEDVSPVPEVIELNSNLTATFNAVFPFLSSANFKYVFGALPKLISDLLISFLKSKIEGINKNGAVKMIRNILELQNFTSIIGICDESLDRAKKYYELLNLSPSELYQYIEDHIHDRNTSFNLNQYRTILENIYNMQNRGHRTLTNEQEKTLREKCAPLFDSNVSTT